MILKISDKYKQISVPIVIIVLLDCFGAKSEVIVALSVAIIVLMCLTGKRIILPKISGLKIYMVSIVIMIAFGFINFNQSKFTKGTYHIIASIIVMILGYYICYVSEKKSLVLTSEILIAFLLIQLLVRSVTHIPSISNLEEVRIYFGVNASTFVILLLIVLTERILNQRIIIGKRIDVILIILGIIRVIMSLNRSTIIAFIVGLAFISIFTVAYKNKRVIMRTVALAASSAIIIFLAFSFLPKESLNEFFDKVDNASNELNSSQEFSSGSNILKNWRGYEIKKARQQWESYSALEMVVGTGIQTYTKMEDMPEDMASMQESMQDKESPILHNGYYTLLVKGGLLAIVGYLVFLVYPLWALIFKAKKMYDKRILIILIGLNAAMAILTYVVRGMISQSVITPYVLSVGWLYCRYHNPVEKEEEDLIEGEE